MVEVVWWDHTENEGPTWMSRADIARQMPATCITIGFLTGGDDDVLRVSSSYVEGEDTYAKPFVIVRSAVRSMRTLTG